MQGAIAAKDACLAALLVAAVAVGGALRMVPGVVGVIDDDAVYAVTARALADGEGYRLVNLPGAPAQTKYPILYPAMIAPAAAMAAGTDEAIEAMQWATVAIGAIAIALAYLYCVRFGVSTRAPAFASCLLAASAPNVLFYCGQTLSELPFLLWWVAALWAAETRLRATGRSPAGEFLTGVMLGLPVLCRTAGVVLPVVALVLLLRARRPVVWVAAGVAAAVAPWFLWVVAASPGGGDAMIAYQTDYWGWWRSHASLTVPTTNLATAFVSLLHIEFEAFARAVYARTDAARWVLGCIGALPWVVVLWRSRSMALLPITLLAYLVLLCAWPWPPDRFLVPMLPFLGAMSLQQLAWLAPARPAKMLAATVLVAAVASNYAMLSRYVADSRESGFPYFVVTPEPVRWEHYREAFSWLREHTRPGEAVASGFDTMTSLYTDRPAIRPFVMRPGALYYGDPGSPVGDVAEFADLLARHHVRYVLLTPMPAYTMESAVFELVNSAVDNRPGLLKPVWQLREDLRFVIFEVQAPAAAP